MKVSYVDLAKTNLETFSLFRDRLSKISAQQWVYGPSCRQFEQKFAEYVGVENCIGVGSGYDALAIIIRALEYLKITPQKPRIGIQHNTFVGALMPFLNHGCEVKVLPVDETSLEINLHNLEPLLPRLDLLVVTHMYGRASSICSLKKLCDSYDVVLIEDCAQSHGAFYPDLAAASGSCGRASIFSFYPTKNLGGLGDGGAICTSDPELATVCRQIGDYGRRSYDVVETVGVNSRLDEIQAMFLIEKLQTLEASQQHRHSNASIYYELLIEKNSLRIPQRLPIQSNAFHHFPVFVKDRNRLQATLKKIEIETKIVYTKSISSHGKNLSARLVESLCNESDLSKYYDSIICLPVAEHLSLHQINYVAEKVNLYA